MTDTNELEQAKYLLSQYLDYFNGEGNFDVSHEADPSETLGEILLKLNKSVDEFLDKNKHF